MSTNSKNKSTKGIRYTDAQKQEIVNFVNDFNAANGRGGQSKAAQKYGVSQLTVSTWLKGKGASKPQATKAPKAAKVAKAPKAAKKAKAGKSRIGSRYTDEQKKEVVDYAVSYNAANGRGGQSKAATKFKVSPLTVVAWLKAAGLKGGAKKVAAKTAKAPQAPQATKAPQAAMAGGIEPKLTALLALSKEITRAEADLARLVARFNAAKASL